MSASTDKLEHLDELRRRKEVFDNTWMLAVLLSASSVVVFWYLGLGQIDVGPVIWVLAALAPIQFMVNTGTKNSRSGAELRRLAIVSQVLGIGVMGLAWHLFGGLQQPMFPLFIMLPLFSGTLILNFWQQQTAMLVFLCLLASGVLLSPDTNSFIEARYGLGVLSAHPLPAWIPRSRVAFLDVSTSPTYNLMLTGSLAILALALTTTSRAIVALSWRSLDGVEALRDELNQVRDFGTKLVQGAPSVEVLITPVTGKILVASERFNRFFALTEPATGKFLLDAVDFAYPIVIKRLITSGGEEIQGATVQGREVVLRIRAGYIDAGAEKSVRLCIEPCDDMCWRRAVDTVDHPMFAVNSRGRVSFLNRSALRILGEHADGADATELFNKGPGMSRWWDIAPLESTRRVLLRGDQRFMVSIRRERIAESIGELSFIQLDERESVRAVSVS